MQSAEDTCKDGIRHAERVCKEHVKRAVEGVVRVIGQAVTRFFFGFFGRRRREAVTMCTDDVTMCTDDVASLVILTLFGPNADDLEKGFVYIII